MLLQEFLRGTLSILDHDEGTAVIGGYVYRGSGIPSLQGRYVFGDWGTFSAPSGRLFYLDDTNGIQEFHIGLDDFRISPFVNVHQGPTLFQFRQAEMLCQIPKPHRIFNLDVVIDAQIKAAEESLDLQNIRGIDPNRLTSME